MTPDNQQKLWHLIEPIKTGMLITNAQPMHGRPMHLVQKEFSGVLYFFTDTQTLKVNELDSNPQVLLTFTSPKDQTYLSINATAKINHDQTLIDKFWNPFVAAWFPQGKNDPTVALIEITVLQAEVWNSNSNKLVQLFEYVKAGVTNSQPDMGEHEKL